MLTLNTDDVEFSCECGVRYLIPPGWAEKTFSCAKCRRWLKRDPAYVPAHRFKNTIVAISKHCTTVKQRSYLSSGNINIHTDDVSLNENERKQLVQALYRPGDLDEHGAKLNGLRSRILWLLAKNALLALSKQFAMFYGASPDCDAKLEACYQKMIVGRQIVECWKEGSILKSELVNLWLEHVMTQAECVYEFNHERPVDYDLFFDLLYRQA